MAFRKTGEPPLTKRLTRPGWRDPRLGVGVVLLASSVALGAWTVDAASATTPIYAARSTLTPGDPVTAADLVLVEANPAAPEGTYLTPKDMTEGVVLRAVGAGELVPTAAVAPEATLDRRPIVLEVPGGLPAAVAPGAVVELWVAPQVSVGTGQEAEPPKRVAKRLEVAAVSDDSSMLGGGVSTSVEVLVDVSEVESVIAAKASGGQLVIVPIESSGRIPARKAEEESEGGADWEPVPTTQDGRSETTTGGQ